MYHACVTHVWTVMQMLSWNHMKSLAKPWELSQEVVLVRSLLTFLAPGFVKSGAGAQPETRPWYSLGISLEAKYGEMPNASQCIKAANKPRKSTSLYDLILSYPQTFSFWNILHWGISREATAPTRGRLTMICGGCPNWNCMSCDVRPINLRIISRTIDQKRAPMLAINVDALGMAPKIHNCSIWSLPSYS